jgi:hypothetical protein
MAKNGILKLIKELDRVASSVVISGPTRAAKRTISELQQEGPSWTGKFSNSWQIETPDGRVYKGDGQPGEPRPIKLPAGLLTGRQNIAGSLPLKDRYVTTVSNFSDHSDQARDLEEDVFIRPTPKPETNLGRRKFDEFDSGREQPSRRGEAGQGSPDRESSRTADFLWYVNYVEGGKLDRAVRIEIDDLFI